MWLLKACMCLWAMCFVKCLTSMSETCIPMLVHETLDNQYPALFDRSNAVRPFPNNCLLYSSDDAIDQDKLAMNELCLPKTKQRKTRSDKGTRKV